MESTIVNTNLNTCRAFLKLLISSKQFSNERIKNPALATLHCELTENKNLSDDTILSIIHDLKEQNPKKNNDTQRMYLNAVDAIMSNGSEITIWFYTPVKFDEIARYSDNELCLNIIPIGLYQQKMYADDSKEIQDESTRCQRCINMHSKQCICRDNDLGRPPKPKISLKFDPLFSSPGCNDRKESIDVHSRGTKVQTIQESPMESNSAFKRAVKNCSIANVPSDDFISNKGQEYESKQLPDDIIQLSAEKLRKFKFTPKMDPKLRRVKEQIQKFSMQMIVPIDKDIRYKESTKLEEDKQVSDCDDSDCSYEENVCNTDSSEFHQYSGPPDDWDFDINEMNEDYIFRPKDITKYIF